MNNFCTALPVASQTDISEPEEGKGFFAETAPLIQSDAHAELAEKCKAFLADENRAVFFPGFDNPWPDFLLCPLGRDFCVNRGIDHKQLAVELLSAQADPENRDPDALRDYTERLVRYFADKELDLRKTLDGLAERIKESLLKHLPKTDRAAIQYQIVEEGIMRAFAVHMRKVAASEKISISYKQGIEAAKWIGFLDNGLIRPQSLKRPIWNTSDKISNLVGAAYTGTVSGLAAGVVMLIIADDLGLFEVNANTAHKTVGVSAVCCVVLAWLIIRATQSSQMQAGLVHALRTRER